MQQDSAMLGRVIDPLRDVKRLCIAAGFLAVIGLVASTTGMMPLWTEMPGHARAQDATVSPETFSRLARERGMMQTAFGEETDETGACCRGGAEAVGCPADLTQSGDVGTEDLFELLGAWGPCPDPENCPADLTQSGDVGTEDLFELLGAWGPCPGDAECDVATLKTCEQLDGLFLGPESECEDCPSPVACPAEAIEEAEPCGESTNDGCSLSPPTYGEALSCGDEVCGMLWAANDQRDEDWYPITITEPTQITWSVDAPYSVEASILTDACPALIAASSTGTNPSVQACLEPGTYILAVRPTIENGLSCDSGLAGYAAAVSCDSCTVSTGACCTPDGGCDEMSSLACFSMDDEAVYIGDDSECGQIDCPFGPPLGLCEDNCQESFIDDGMGGTCDCDDFCHAFDTCCPGVCDDCPDVLECDPALICSSADGDCCQPNDSPGCVNEDCCELVCNCDPHCCEAPWDVFCALDGPCSAAELCPSCGGGGPSCSTVSCSNNEGEPCGESLNDGCVADETDPPFGTVACGETICGNLWAASSPSFPNGFRDTDWFLLDLSGASSTVEITWSATAEEPVQLFVLTPTCDPEVVAGPVTDCEPSITVELNPGEYVLFIAPIEFNGLPCPGFTYEATVTCGDVPGECDGFCGGTAPSGCFCDDECIAFGDCCPGICNDCPNAAGCN